VHEGNRQTDNGNIALCTIVHRVVKKAAKSFRTSSAFSHRLWLC